MEIFLIVLGFVLLIGLIIVHELGHFMVARRNGVVAEEFGIFFPPRLFKKRIKSKKGDFDFTFNLLPLGGFVKLKGENDADKRKGTFGSASLWVKFKIMAAGVLVNVVLALILLTILAAVGMPKVIPNQFTVKSDTTITENATYAAYVEPNSPAAHAGLTKMDRIMAIGPAGHVEPVKQADDLHLLTQKFAGQKVQLVYQNDGNQVTKTVDLRKDAKVHGEQQGHLGVAVEPLVVRRSTWSAPIVAVGISAQYTKLLFQGLGHAFSGLAGIVSGWVSGNQPARTQATQEARDQFVSPYGLYFVYKIASHFGISYILAIIAIISLTLGIINFLPLPAVDGRVWLLLISRAIKRPMSIKVENILNSAVFIIVAILGVLLIVSDIFKFN